MVCIHLQILRHVRDSRYWYWDLLSAFAGCVNPTLTWTSKGNSAAGWMPPCVWLCVYICPETLFFMGHQLLWMYLLCFMVEQRAFRLALQTFVQSRNWLLSASKDVCWERFACSCTRKRGRCLGIWRTRGDVHLSKAQLWASCFLSVVSGSSTSAWVVLLLCLKLPTLFQQVLDHICSTPWGPRLPSWEPQAPFTTRLKIPRGWVPTRESTAAPSRSCHRHHLSKCYFLVTMVAPYVELWVS